MESFEIGDIVTASYKTGRYIGEVVDFKPKLEKAVVKMRAVLVHPKQGDLHAPNQADVQFFHERKALAHTEKALVPLSSIKRFEGDIPTYETSLLEAVQKQMDRYEKDSSDFARASYQNLQNLLKEYQR
jgi:kinase-associated protein B